VGKPTKAEHRKRVNQVRMMLATGYTRADILQYAADKWGSAERTGDDYIATATAEIQAGAKTSKEEDVAAAREVYRAITREQIGRGDLRGAAQTQDKFCRLLGLDAPSKTEVTGGDGGAVKVVVEHVGREEWQGT